MSTTCSSDQDPKPAKSHQEAFEYYASLGPERTYRQVAEKLGVSLPTVKRWAKTNKWLSRVDEREAQVARQVADRAVDSAAEDLGHKRKLVKAALIRLGQAIGQGKIKLVLSDLDRMIRLDSMLQGHPDGMLIGASGAGAGSAEELRAYLEMTPTCIIEDYAVAEKERARLGQAKRDEEKRRHDQNIEDIRRQENRGARRETGGIIAGSILIPDDTD